MTSRFIGFVFCLVLTLFQLSTIPPVSAQLFKLKTSYSALTANMAAYWLAKETRLFEKHGLDVDVVLIESGLPYGLLAQKEIKTLEQLKGKRHAISRFGSIADLGSRLILQRFGLTP